MNILDIVDNGTFLNKIYPDGLVHFSLGSFVLTQDRITMVLHEETEPAIQVEKWGEWEKDYNIVAIEFLGTVIHKATISNWQNNKESVRYEQNIFVQDDQLNIQFKGVDWYVEFVLSTLVFQRCSTYLKG
ncbi:hypothetical protein ACKUSY_10335 [Myroides odoratus]